MPEALSELLRQAAEHRGMRRFDRAFPCYELALRSGEHRAEVLVERAITWYYASNYTQAAEDATQALALAPDSTGALLYLALSLEKELYPKAAMAAYDRLLSTDATYTIAYTNRASLHQQLRQFDKAEADLDEALRLDPTDYKAHFNLGNLLYALGRREQSLAAPGILRTVSLFSRHRCLC